MSNSNYKVRTFGKVNIRNLEPTIIIYRYSRTLRQEFTLDEAENEIISYASDISTISDSHNTVTSFLRWEEFQIPNFLLCTVPSVGEYITLPAPNPRFVGETVKCLITEVNYMNDSVDLYIDFIIKTEDPTDEYAVKTSKLNSFYNNCLEKVTRKYGTEKKEWEDEKNELMKLIPKRRLKKYLRSKE